MDILLFSSNSRKAEYFSLKSKAAGHSVFQATTLSSVHYMLRRSDPDFVIVDSDTFPDPPSDYRTIVSKCRRKFHLFYDKELLPLQMSTLSQFSEAKRNCLLHIVEILQELQIHNTLVSGSFPLSSEEERLLLKKSRLKPSLALILSCLLRNRDTDISANTLLSLLWTDSSSTHQQTLYAYINQLRDYLKTRNIPVVIERRNKGSYCLSIKKSCLCMETAFQ